MGGKRKSGPVTSPPGASGMPRNVSPEVVIELDTREEVEVVEHSGPIPPNVSTVL
jgi:hypothetical protein